ncbi:MAG: sugar transferase [Bacteroidota bacterium]
MVIILQSDVIKRFLDLAIAAVGLLILSPVLAILALLILLTMGRPVLFHQARAGLCGQPFTLHKLRTMKNPAPGVTASADEKRLTPLGAFLRDTSLDELPELLNVLRGEMSLVGPRPLLMSYNARYDAEQARRLTVRPGLTGWAQINGRNNLSWEARFALDVWYVDHWSLRLDLKILGLTILKVIKRDGVHAREGLTMPEFTGSIEHR